MERKTRFELATLALARRCSTTEPLPQISWCPEAESNHRHEDFQSSALPTELSGHVIFLSLIYILFKYFFKFSLNSVSRAFGTKLRYYLKLTATSSCYFGYSLIPTELSGHVIFLFLIYILFKYFFFLSMLILSCLRH